MISRHGRLREKSIRRQISKRLPPDIRVGEASAKDRKSSALFQEGFEDMLLWASSSTRGAGARRRGRVGLRGCRSDARMGGVLRMGRGVTRRKEGLRGGPVGWREAQAEGKLRAHRGRAARPGSFDGRRGPLAAATR
jgi:hypothetical protein